MEDRELKFRAWDGTRMIFFGDLSIGLSKSKKETSPYVYFTKDTFNGTVSLGKHRVMQYTGLKDKNGKDIYEGDIISTKYEDKCDPSGFGLNSVEVTFKDGSFGWIGEVTGEFFPFATDPFDDCEVTGNIYENKEVLK